MLTHSQSSDNHTTAPLKEVAQVFFKLGLTAFGGPAVHIAMLREEVVVRRKWMDEQRFLDLMGMTNLIPGPNSTEMCMHSGYVRAGWKGLWVAGLAFILPAVAITALLAYLYQSYGSLPQVRPFVYAIPAAMIAILFSLVLRLGPKAASTFRLRVIGLMTLGAVLMGLHEVYALFGAGLLALVWNRIGRPLPIFIPLAWLPFPPLSAGGIFLTFLKVGGLLYGSGYVLFAFLEAELVQQGLLSARILLDAIAVGQFTPGPVFSSATFIGWQMGGWQGALAATLGIFLPSFFLVGLLTPIVSRLRQKAWVGLFLDAVNVASLALVLAVCLQMGREALGDWRTALVALLGLLVTWKLPKLNTAWLVLGASLLGYVLQLV